MSTVDTLFLLLMWLWIWLVRYLGILPISNTYVQNLIIYERHGYLF